MAPSGEADQVLGAVLAALRDESADDAQGEGLDLSALDGLMPEQRRVLAEQLRGALALPAAAGSKDTAVRRHITAVIARLDP